MAFKLFSVFVISILPVLELRGSLIWANLNSLPFLAALPVAVLGNLVPVPLILFLFEWCLKFFSRRRWVGPLLQRFWKRAERKAEKIGNYELFGLFLFVAIPLPGTGAWTGALIASVLKLNRTKAMLAISLGVLAAGLIVSFLCYLLPGVFHTFFY